MTKTSRMYRGRVSLWGIAISTLVISAISVIVCVFFGQDFGVAIGVGGYVAAVAVPLLVAVREKRDPKKKIAFIGGTADPTFESNVLASIQSRLSGVVNHQLDVLSAARESSAGQLAILDSDVVKSAHAIVIVPNESSDDIWQALANCIRMRITVVVLDVEPPRRFFEARGLAVPYYVASDFIEGGDLAGNYISSRLESASALRSLILVGPNDSVPGLGRSGRVLLRLSLGGFLSRVSSITLPGWDNEAVSSAVVPDLTMWMKSHKSRVILFAGDDRLAVQIYADIPDWCRSRVSIVGYDGSTSPTGDYVIKQARSWLATVDTNPRKQGLAAADLLIGEYQNTAMGDRQRLISPSLIESVGT